LGSIFFDIYRKNIDRENFDFFDIFRYSVFFNIYRKNIDRPLRPGSTFNMCLTSSGNCLLS